MLRMAVSQRIVWQWAESNSSENIKMVVKTSDECLLELLKLLAPWLSLSEMEAIVACGQKKKRRQVTTVLDPTNESVVAALQEVDPEPEVAIEEAKEEVKRRIRERAPRRRPRARPGGSAGGNHGGGGGVGGGFILAS